MHSRATPGGGEGRQKTLWAICPCIPTPDRALIMGPVVFDSAANAEAFLNQASVLVYDGWGRGEEKNFESREKWLRAIASVWVRPLRNDPLANLTLLSADNADVANRENEAVG